LKRRVFLSGLGFLLCGGAGAWFFARRGPGEPISLRSYDWSGDQFRAGGTKTVALTQLPAPEFPPHPQCITTAAKTIGPCHTDSVPIRQDVTEGVAGLPTRICLRLVHASDCSPVEGADVEIWHADARGIYSGPAERMCNAGDTAARSAAYLRGRQITDGDGQVEFLSVYPGWYSGRAVHIHLRILYRERELLLSQLLFDDALSDLIYASHPDYKQRPRRDTMNGGDNIFSATEAPRFIFDTTKLEGGILQASFVVGLQAAG